MSEREQSPQGIGWAMKQLWDGKKVRRAGWNGKDMFLILIPAQNAILKEGHPYAKALPGFEGIHIDPHIDMFTAQGTMQPGWLASQADLRAADWEVC